MTTTEISIYFAILSFLMVVYVTLMFYSNCRLVQEIKSLKNELNEYKEYYNIGIGGDSYFEGPKKTKKASTKTTTKDTEKKSRTSKKAK